jgi:hypothetical protein
MNRTSKSSGNIIDLIPGRLSELLDAFKDSSSLSDFLRVLDVLATLKVDVPEVWQTWDRLNKEVSGQEAVRSVLAWRSSLDFWSCADDEADEVAQPYEPPQIGLNMEVFKHARDLAAQEEEITEYIQARIKDPSYAYGPFVAALPIETILRNFPIIDEAAKLIGQYIKAFFRGVEERPVAQSEAATPVRHPGIRRFIEENLIPWSLEAERRYWESNSGHEGEYRLAQLKHIEEIRAWSCCSLDLSEPDTYPPGFSLAVLARAIPYLPQAQVSIEGILDEYEFNEDFLEIEGCAELVDVLLSLPLSKPFDSWFEYENVVPENSLLREYAQDVYTINELPSLSLEFYAKLFFDLSIVAPPFADLTSLLQLPNEDDSQTVKRLRALIESGIKRLTDVRRSDFGNGLPLEQEVVAWMGGGIYSTCKQLEFSPRHDISYLISVNGDGKGFGLCSFFSYDLNKGKRFARARSESFMLAFDAAIDEGWYEFATASLAFYLFSQPILYDGELHADWHRLSQILRAAINLPGAERVKHSAALALNIMRENGKENGLDALCLSAWAEKTLQTRDITPDISERVLNLRQIVKELIEQIGEEAWLKLGLQGKRQLQDAEGLWSSMHMKLGRGEGDFGSVATAYVKVFEGEIKDRMLPVTSTQPFIAYYRNTYRKNPEGHIGFGELLFLLKKFERLPFDLRDVIRATGIRVQDDRALVDNLFKAMQYRNNGAHAGPFNEKQFIDLRKLIFEDQSLKRFIGLL